MIPTQADMKNNTSASMHDMHDPIHGLDSNLLKVAVGLSALVFIIMLQAHHNHDPDSPHSGYITGVCHNIAVEVFDSVSTGYFLSDQHILSPIDLKCDYCFCQIYKDLHTQIFLQVLNFKTICVNLKILYVIFWVSW